ncbi:hypothetical protein CLV63_10764 [Murinocardiopsis flavida]|uniref:CDP-glycerol:poly(Glycerophosphate) glycerophosphotransferase n=1 Tax=Murinocardiopsis flavida TaxID=645275 RepID=A0A2P8DKD2_9ACTN|nr:hypothetical protein [Murinocardiopsis flavida]PSK97676.1 hypothetical protein CLV63_10764 [Murinocardiopsis flavida]
MSVHERLSVPVGAAAATWSTRPGTRRVLVVAHTVTALTRLLDVLPLLESDFRVQVVATRARTSNFREGVTEFLSDTGLAVIPWDQAVEEEFDLAITASLGDDLQDIKAPIVVLPHGIGYNKLEKGKGKREKGKGKREKGSTFGISAETLIRHGALIPAALVLSHPEQLDRLRSGCPEAVPRAVVAGDPAFDRILAGLPWRARYRRALGTGTRRLILLSSTWGPSSLLGSRPDLIGDLLRALPVDEYQVVLAAHPNLWHGHGDWQVRAWLAGYERAGLRVLPPRAGWQAALIAADHVIGDHGSVTAYGAALGTHTMLGAFPHGELDPGSPIAAFGRAARLLEDDKPLLDQITDDAAVHSDDRFAAATRLLTCNHGAAGTALRTVFYRFLGVAEPVRPPRTVPPEVPHAPRRAWPDAAGRPPLLVTAEHKDGDVAVRRFPAEMFDGTAPRPERPHLVAADDEPDPRWRESADILLIAEPGTGAGPTGPARIAELLRAHPAARFAALRADRGAVVGDRGGRLVRLAPEAGADPLDPDLLPSAYWRVRAEGTVDDRGSAFTVRTGSQRARVRVEPMGR